MYSISIIDPLDRAWNGMVARLFKPFQAGKWFALGFSAWLAQLLSGSGFPSFSSGDMKGLKEIYSPLRDAWIAYSSIIIPVLAVGTLILIVFVFTLLWLTSRGSFMFLRNVVDDTGEVSKPWHEYRAEGNSLFFWQVGYSIIACTIMIALSIAIIFLILPFISGEQPASAATNMSTIFIGGMIGLIFFAAVMVLLVITTLLFDCVVPLMMKHRIRCSEAWFMLLPLLKQHAGTFILYLLFRLALYIGAAMLIGIMVILTCCCLLFLMIIPYINAVVLLPISVFFRLYSIEFLRGFGENFDVFTKAPPDNELPAGDTADIPSPS